MAGVGNLQSLLTSSEKKHLIKSTGETIEVETLKGKPVLLYFAHFSTKVAEFLMELGIAYMEIKSQDPAFEIVYVCSDLDGYQHRKLFSIMPWLAVPSWDERGKSLTDKFVVPGMNNRLLAFGRDGEMLTEDARDFVTFFGAGAYPFTEEHLNKLQKQWPSELRGLHVHDLALTRAEHIYKCAKCDEKARGWSYFCGQCDYSVQPHCLFGVDRKEDWTKFKEEKLNKFLGAGSSKTE